MASADAVNSLVSGNNTWIDYLARHVGVIDLTFADLSGKDLRGRTIRHCDFSGARLAGANLDHATIESCKFVGTNLSAASLVHCNLHNVIAQNMMAESIVIRDSILVGVDLTESNMSSAIIDSSSLQNCTFRKVQGNGLAVSSCKLKGCILSRLTLPSLQLRRCQFEGCDLTEWIIDDIEILDTVIEGSTIARLTVKSGSACASKFIECRIDELCLGGPVILCRELDFSRSTIARTDLSLIGLSTATMLDTALISCTWPTQRGSISSTGKYLPSMHLLGQPVQDLKGVPPLTRREIADAQYLVRKIASCSGLGRRGMQLWGLCAGFGQSLGRLALTTCGLMSAATIALLGARHQLIGNTPNFDLLRRAARDSFDAFFALANIPDTAQSTELLVVILTRISGFLILGLWVTIASSKLSRLGAE